MNDDRKEELLTRWMGDALSAEELRELEPLLAKNPELNEERVDYRKLRDELKAAIPAEVEPPYPDFFNSHLERLVREASRDEQVSEGASRGFSRIWLWWMAPAATAVVVGAFLLGMQSVQPPDSPGLADASSSEIYSPLATVETKIIRDAELDATLIVVEGLDDLDDQDLVIGGGSIEGEHGFFVNTGEIY